MLKVYEYKNCSTCKKALKFLDHLGITYKAIPIVEHPPSKEEILKMITFYDGKIKPLFNTSGQLYRQMDMKSKIDALTAESAAELLSQHGKLIKRPFAIQSKLGLVGFKEDLWQEKLT